MAPYKGWRIMLTLFYRLFIPYTASYIVEDQAMCSVWFNFKLLRCYILLYTVQCNVAQILSNNAPLYAKIKITLRRIYSREINALTIKIICRRNKFPEAIDVLYTVQ